MQRSLRNEVLIAVIAMSIIICGLFFALVLSNPETPSVPTNISSSLVTPVAQSNTDDVPATEETEASEPTATDTEIPSETPTATATDTEIPSETPTVTATDTEIPSETPTATATDTEIPSETPTAIVTNTEIPSETPTATATDTEIPSETSEPKSTEALEPTATDTEIPSETPTATATNTEVPSETPTATATNTEIPSETPTATATNTEVPSETPTPTPTPTATATNTEVPSETPTLTMTFTPSNTPRPSATSTSVNAVIGIIPTLPASPTVAPLDEPTRTPASCDLPQGWTSYVVQERDTLFAISLVTNSTVDELRFANCIDDADNITAGESIFVPIDPVRPVSTLVPSGIRQGLTIIGCTNPNIRITSPITAQRLNGLFNVYGTAIQDEFQYYKIEIRPDFAEIYNFYSSSESQVTTGVLSLVNADLFGEGLHWIRLTVVDIRGGIRPDATCEIPVIFE